MTTSAVRPPAADPRLIARLYQETRERIATLVTALDEQALSTAVAACPGWSVRDVVAHVTAVAEDGVSGRLAGPPTNAQTAAQVARFDGYGIAEILDAWAPTRPDSWTTWPKTRAWNRLSVTSRAMSTTFAVRLAGQAPVTPGLFGIPLTGCSTTCTRPCRCA
jgi:hypothetical protein